MFGTTMRCVVCNQYTPDRCTCEVKTRSIKATALKAGMTLAYRNPRQNVIIDSVEDTRDGGVRLRCGYSKGDDSMTFFFEQEENVLIMA
jgi:hypothetical protein